ncbi:glycosyl hydrolase family 18 protein [Cohnella mopanensis]|uniref:glycosyl hydrolase family 18 protein n=1 Tax=Cohnella mopanensis TaxID=2911966 RepID=UPI001EF943FE|nr:glycosyl hydrolase family 18 protein [Cohnella mopanensis]
MFNKQPPRKRVALGIILVAFISATIFLYLIKLEAFGAGKKPPVTEHVTERSAWLADWQWETGMKDLEKIAGKLTSLQMFAAYFDGNDRLMFTEEFHEVQPKLLELANESVLKHVDLTLVNDIKKSDGTSVAQKDTSLVARLTGTEESRSSHIADIVAAVEAYGFGGVEIDYERVDNADWNNVSLFLSDLQTKLQSMGKTLRVVLEPRAPIEEVKLPEGPTYVLMAYNLYGGHSEPGPKADHDFIKKLALRLKHLSGNPYLALSTGGFDWNEQSGKVTSLTEKQAADLSKLSRFSPARDADSGSLYFEYTDADQAKHTVWYADEVTLADWIDTAKKAKCYNIAIWRLGELGEGTLQAV